MRKADRMKETALKRKEPPAVRGECGEKRAAGLKNGSGHDRRCRRKIMGRNRRKATAAEQIQAIYEKKLE